MILSSNVFTVVRYGDTGVVDRLGKPVIGELSRSDVEGRLEQSGSTEGSEAVVGRWVAHMPPGTVLDSNDRVVESGRTFSVEGSPADMSIPGFPFLDHVLVTLTYIGG